MGGKGTQRRGLRGGERPRGATWSICAPVPRLQSIPPSAVVGGVGDTVQETLPAICHARDRPARHDRLPALLPHASLKAWCRLPKHLANQSAELRDSRSAICMRRSLGGKQLHTSTSGEPPNSFLLSAAAMRRQFWPPQRA